MNLDLSQFASLFEIGFAVHIAVALIERIYARELPVRIERISARLNALERFKQEIQRAVAKREESGQSTELQLPYRSITDPVWADRNDALLDRLYALGHNSTGRLSALKRILGAITILSVIVVLYSITMLFLIGLQLEMTRELSPMFASALVLAQLLPLPLAAAIFYYVARRMSKEVDRKLRGIGEMRVMLLASGQSGIAGHPTIEEVYQRDLVQEGRLAAEIV